MIFVLHGVSNKRFILEEFNSKKFFLKLINYSSTYRTEFLNGGRTVDVFLRLGQYVFLRIHNATINSM